MCKLSVSVAVLALIVVSADPAAAQAQLAVNGVAPPTAITVTAGSTVSVAITNGPGNPTDWLGLYAAGASDYTHLDWRFMNGTQTAPATGVTSATVNFPLLTTPGEYEFRFFANFTYQRLAVSGPVAAVPPPTVTSVTPSSGHIGNTVTIAGTNFGATQDASTVTFNGTAATPVNWSDGSLTVPVPSGATTGSVVVTVFGGASNGSTFTVTVVLPGTISGTITRASGGSAISGATVQAIQAGIMTSTATTAADGTYAITNLAPATYAVRVLASGFSSALQSTGVSSSTTSTVNVALSQPGSVSGTVTQANGTTPIAGAAVTLYLGAVATGSTSTSSLGAYSMASLAPGAYTVQAASVGFHTTSQGATIAENANTTTNLSLDAAVPGPVNYVYDELGRLVSVIDPSGDAANYVYDAVGNLLSIARAGTGTVSISEVAPHNGPVGSAVTLYGTGFSATPASNTVTFNGTVATVTAASPTQLATAVPAGATTGVITVTTPTGAATSGAAFVVTAPAAGIPTITSVSPQIWDGTSALTVTGTNFDPTPANDRVNLNVAYAASTTATATSLGVAVPATATSGHVTVGTIAGTVISTADFFIPPAGYLAANVQSTGRMTLGSTQTISLPTAGTLAMWLFDGIAGHRVSALFTNVTIGTGTAPLYDPMGRPIGSATFGYFPTLFIDAVTMGSSATYTLVVAASGTSTGNATVTVYDIPSDITGPIVPGGAAVTVATTIPGQNGRLTFSGTAGQRVSLDQSGSNCSSSTTTIQNPDGSPLASTCGGYFLDVQTLPTTGTYTILVDPLNAITLSTTLTLYTVPADVTGSIVPGGAAVTVTTTVPGQNGRLTFSGTTGQKISLDQSGYNCFSSTTTIQNPDGSTLVSTCGGNFLDVQTLPSTGTYTLLVDPLGAITGSSTLTLYDATETTATATIGGSAVPVTLLVPGQNGTVTFGGTSGQSVTVHVTGNTMWIVTVSLLGTDGVTVLATSFNNAATFDLSTVTLGATGTYTVRIDPYATSTGTLNISVTNP